MSTDNSEFHSAKNTKNQILKACFLLRWSSQPPGTVFHLIYMTSTTLIFLKGLRVGLYFLILVIVVYIVYTLHHSLNVAQSGKKFIQQTNQIAGSKFADKL